MFTPSAKMNAESNILKDQWALILMDLLSLSGCSYLFIRPFAADPLFI